MSEFREYERDGIRYREEGGRTLIRRGMVWYDLASYHRRFGEPERKNVIPFRRKEGA